MRVGLDVWSCLVFMVWLMVGFEPAMSQQGVTVHSPTTRAKIQVKIFAAAVVLVKTLPCNCVCVGLPGLTGLDLIASLANRLAPLVAIRRTTTVADHGPDAIALSRQDIIHGGRRWGLLR